MPVTDNVSASLSLSPRRIIARGSGHAVPAWRRCQAAGWRTEPHPADEAALRQSHTFGGPQLYRGNVLSSGRTTVPCASAPLTRHAEIENSAAVSKIPILHDCAAGIADVQVRNRGTIGGSLAEADPSGDWAVVLLTLYQRGSMPGQQWRTHGRPCKISFKTPTPPALAHDELVSEVVVKIPRKEAAEPISPSSARLRFIPRPAPPCSSLWREMFAQDAAIALGCVGLTAIKAKDAEAALRGQAITEKTLAAAHGSRARRRRSAIRHAWLSRLQTHAGSRVGQARHRHRRSAAPAESTVEVSHIYA